MSQRIGSSAITSAPLSTDVSDFVATVALGWRRNVEVRVDASAITWDGRAIRLSSIDHIGYEATPRTLNFTSTGIAREIRLMVGGELLVLNLGCRPEDPSDPGHGTYAAIVGVLHGRVEPRLCRAAVQRLTSAGTLNLAGIIIDDKGLTVPGRWRAATAAWSELPYAQLDDSAVVVRTSASENDLVRIPTIFLDAVLLPDLLAGILRAGPYWEAAGR